MFAMDKKRSIIYGVLLIICAVFFLFCLSNKKSQKKPRPAAVVAAVTVKSSKISTALESIGTVVSNEATDITSNVSQIVTKVNFSDCDVVKKGQLLVQLNIDRELAAKKQAEINLSEQKREHNRLLALKKKSIVPEKEYDLQSTKMHDAQAKLDEINAEINDSSIVAPFDGILGVRKVSVGALITPGTIITTIDDIKKVKVDFAIPEKYVHLLKQGSEIIAESSAVPDEKFRGKISAIPARISVTSRSVSVRSIIDNEDYLLRPGMMVKVTIPTKAREAIQIPERAVANIGEKHYVFVLIPLKETDKSAKKKQKRQPCTAKIRYVTIGEREEGVVEITDGLRVGESIVTDGIGKLSDGVTVFVERQK
jgi:membrane fusion protein (multidrug efflux system)